MWKEVHKLSSKISLKKNIIIPSVIYLSTYWIVVSCHNNAAARTFIYNSIYIFKDIRVHMNKYAHA